MQLIFPVFLLSLPRGELKLSFPLTEGTSTCGTELSSHCPLSLLLQPTDLPGRLLWDSREALGTAGGANWESTARRGNWQKLHHALEEKIVSIQLAIITYKMKPVKMFHLATI